MSKENFDRFIEWHKAQREAERKEQNLLINSIFSTFEWIARDRQDIISQIASGLKKSRKEIYLEIIRGSLPFIEAILAEKDQTIFKRWIEPYLKNKEAFLPFAEEHLTMDILQKFRSSKFNQLRHIWNNRVSRIRSASHLLGQLEANDISYPLTEEELVEACSLTQEEFKSKYVDKILIPELQKLESAHEKTRQAMITLSLSKVKKMRIEVATYLSERHPTQHIEPNRLYDLSHKLKTEGRIYLKTKLGGGLTVSDTVKEVFRKPRNRK